MQTPESRPLQDHPVADIMTRDLLTLGPEESVLMAWELMCQNQSHHLPVVDDEGHCLGVIDAQTISTTWEASSPQRARRPVRVLLQHRPFIPVSPHDTVAAAARVMLRLGTDHVAVVDEDLLVGLLTARDLISALAGRMKEDEGHAHPGLPSLYRIEPVLPEHHDHDHVGRLDQPGHPPHEEHAEHAAHGGEHRRRSMMSPD